EELLNLGDTGRATDQNNVVNLALLNLGILKNLLDRLEGALEQVHVDFLKLSTGQSLGEVLAVVEGFDFDTGGHLGRKSTLGLLDFTLQLVNSLEVLGDIDILILVVDLCEVLDNTVIEIFTTKMSVTSGRKNLEDSVLDGKERNIESTTTKI